MTPEEKSLLERTAALVLENNQILRKIRRGYFWANVAKISYIVIILALVFGAYYFIQPYFDQTLGLLNDIGGTSGIQKVIQGASSTPR